MYKIKSDDKTLHDIRDEEYMLLTPKISLELNKTGNLDFGILPTHPEIGSIEKLRSRIAVYDDDELLYAGRPTTDEADFYNYGQVSCEGELAFLLDSIQRPKERGRTFHFEPVSTNTDVFRAIIKEHNVQVEESKRFEIGVIDIESVSVENFDANYEKTWDLLNSQFTGVYEGYLRVRHENGMRYLDYVKQYGKDSSQGIRFGENLLDLKRYIKADDIATAIIPVGKNNVTIKTANGHDGKDYIYDPEAVELYGWIYQKVDFSDVNDPDTLLEKAREHLKTCINLSITIELTAIDLHLIDVDIDRIKLGDTVRVVSPVHHLDRRMTVSKREYNLTDPSSDKITLGDTLSCLTQKQAGLQKDMKLQKNAVSSELEHLILKVDEAYTGIDTMGGQVQQLGTDLSGMAARLQQLETGFSEIMPKLQGYETNISEMTSKLQEMERAVTSLTENNNTIQETIRGITARIEILERGEEI